MIRIGTPFTLGPVLDGPLGPFAGPLGFIFFIGFLAIAYRSAMKAT